jgi:hypothetical protein
MLAVSARAEPNPNRSAGLRPGSLAGVFLRPPAKSG